MTDEITHNEIAALLVAAILQAGGELRFTKEEVEAIPQTPSTLLVEFDPDSREMVAKVVPLGQ